MSLMQRREPLSYVDFFKAVGAITIILYHYQFIVTYMGYAGTWTEGDAKPLAALLGGVYRYGYMAVEFFFFLSGFTLEYSQHAPIRNGTLSCGAFLKGKLLKLYPMYLLTTLLCMLVKGIAVSFSQGAGSLRAIFPGSTVVLNLLLLQGGGLLSTDHPYNSPAWYLTAQLFCYVIYYKLAQIKKDDTFILISCACMLSGMISIFHGLSFPIFNARMMGRALLCVFAGVLTQRFQWNIHDAGRRKVIGYAALVLSLISLILLRSPGNLYLFSCFFCAVLVLAFANVPALGRILSLPVFHKCYTAVYQLSFPLFLCHYPVLIIFSALDRFLGLNRYYDTVWFLMVYLTASVLLALLLKQIDKRLRLSSHNVFQEAHPCL